jgi:2-keto-3-deoxy-L-rhamnonate aldolase
LHIVFDFFCHDNMAPSTPPPPGIYVPVPTFFKSAPTTSNPVPALDLEAQLKHGLHLARNGIRGLVLLGSSGETISLSSAERSELVSYVKNGFEKEGFKDYPIIAGTTAQGIEEVINELKAAKESGAAWGMVLAPAYFAAGGGAAGIGQWFEAVAARSPIPIMMYVRLKSWVSPRC